MGFFDAHSHTPDLSSCCSREITLDHYAEAVATHDWLDGIVITNHGFTTYFPPEIAKTWRFMRQPELFDKYEEFGNQRIMDFIGRLAPFYGSNLVMGMEIEMLSDGRFTVSDKVRDYIEVLVGSLHWGPMDGTGRNPKVIWDFIFNYYEMMMRKGVDIIAHPFRWPHKSIGVIPDETIIKEFVFLLDKYDVAGEINGHVCYDYDLFFLETMLEHDVKVAFSSDCHSVKEVGDFNYHFGLLEQLAIGLDDVNFWRPKQFRGLSDQERFDLYGRRF